MNVLSWLLVGIALFMFVLVFVLIGILIYTIIDTYEKTHQWKDKQMRRYESLVKRINLCENELSSMDNEQDADGLFRAYKLMRYLRDSYRVLTLNGIKLTEDK